MKISSTIRIFSLVAVFVGLSACTEEKKPDQTTASEPSAAPAKATTEVVDVDAKEADTLLKENPDIVVVDVRTPAEFSEGHVKDAVNIDFKNPNFEEELIKLDPGKTYLLHCRSGSRSGQALPLFEKHGFAKLYHMTPGFNGWMAAGNEVVK